MTRFGRCALTAAPSSPVTLVDFELICSLFVLVLFCGSLFGGLLFVVVVGASVQPPPRGAKRKRRVSAVAKFPWLWAPILSREMVAIVKNRIGRNCLYVKTSNFFVLRVGHLEADDVIGTINDWNVDCIFL